MEGLQFVELDEIMYCESQDNYTRFFLIDGRKIMVSKTIKHFEEMLDPYKFYRVHRSNIINLKYIDKYAETGKEYVKILQQIIRQNLLTDFDDAKLLPSSIELESLI